MKLQVNSRYPYHAVVKELLYNHECDQIRDPLAKFLDKRTPAKNGTPKIPKKPSADWTEIRVMKKYDVYRHSYVYYNK